MLGSLIKGTSARAATYGDSIRVRNWAIPTVFASMALTATGVYAIDIALSYDAGGLHPTAVKQVLLASIGMFAGALIALPHYRFMTLLAAPAMFLALALLIFLLIPAVPTWLVTPRNGARGWINLGVTDIQPSEVAKIAFVLMVAKYMRYRHLHRKFVGLIPIGVAAMVPVGLITLQPDLGTAGLFIPALFAMLVAAGARLRHLAIIVIIATLAAPATYPLLKSHQKARIVAMINLLSDDNAGAYEINYQPLTAQRISGAGGLTGMSDAHTRAVVHHNHLPERHNDMIFSVIVARFGLLGGLALIGMYLVWIVGALMTAASCREPFGRLMVIGLAAFIAAQVIVNIGMNIGLLPIIGITLPFVSAGGSSMLTVWLITGLIYNVGLHRTRGPLRTSFEYQDHHG